MTATKNKVPPSSTLVMTALVLRTSPSSTISTLNSVLSLSIHGAYTPRSALFWGIPGFDAKLLAEPTQTSLKPFRWA